MNKFLVKLKEDVIQVIPAVIYFCICFNLIHFNSTLTHKPTDLHYYTYFGVTVASLLVGKIILIVNMFPTINAFPNKPIIYNTIWKLFFYNFVILLVRIVEMLIHYYFLLGGFSESHQATLAEISSPMFWSTELCLVVVFFGYIFFSEFVRVLGKPQVMEMIFGK